MTARSDILAAASVLEGRSADRTFTADDVLGELRRRGTAYADPTIRTHVTSVMCADAPDNHGTVYDDLERVGRGRYRLRRSAIAVGHPAAGAVSPTLAEPARRPETRDPALIAGTVDLATLMRTLATNRPVFHSEADFQLEFGWHLRTADPHLQVRLETKPRPGAHLDVLARDPSTGRSTAIELKYLTNALSHTVNDEPFALVRQSATDIRAYDVVKDIHRVEGFVADGTTTDGLVVVLSNEIGHWRDPAHGRETGAAAFRIYDGTVLSGERAWGPRAGPGTRKGREEALRLSGTYTLAWDDYSDIGVPSGKFRWLATKVGGTAV